MTGVVVVVVVVLMELPSVLSRRSAIDCCRILGWLLGRGWLGASVGCLTVKLKAGSMDYL